MRRELEKLRTQDKQELHREEEALAKATVLFMATQIIQAVREEDVDE